MVTGETPDTFTQEASFFPAPIRQATGITFTVTVLSAIADKSKTTLDNAGAEAAIDMFGLTLTAYVTNSYVGDHGWPMYVGKAWTMEEFSDSSAGLCRIGWNRLCGRRAVNAEVR